MKHITISKTVNIFKIGWMVVKKSVSTHEVADSVNFSQDAKTFWTVNFEITRFSTFRGENPNP